MHTYTTQARKEGRKGEKNIGHPTEHRPCRAKECIQVPMGKSGSKQFTSNVLKAHNENRGQHSVPPEALQDIQPGNSQNSETLASTRILKDSPESSCGQCGHNCVGIGILLSDGKGSG